MKSKTVLLASRWKTATDDRLRKSKLRTYFSLVSGLMVDHGLVQENNQFVGAFRARQADKLLELASALESCAFEGGKYSFPAVQIAALIKKYPFDSSFTGLDPEGTALRTFLLAEDKCSRVNEIIRKRRTSYNPVSERVQRARNWIAYVLGETPNYKAIYRECGFGPGASVGVHGKATSFARKMLADSWTSTPTALPYFVASISTDPLFWELLVDPAKSRESSQFADLSEAVAERTSFTVHNTIAFVPKTAKTNRSIAVEPLLNSWVQKGVDVYMRKLLLRVGIDLSDQSRNQEWARMGSLPSEDPYCTIDLSSASDSISIELVRELLPPDWFDFLNQIRSPAYVIDGEQPVRYHKFVSMGNGFCFPLESLIFGSICHACGAASRDFAVYGDDIIVRQSIYSAVEELLTECGFTLNPAKSFSSGEFRESCGADWYAGLDVRPLTLDYELDCVQNVIKFSNLSRRRRKTETIFETFREEIRRDLLGDICPFIRPYKGNDDSALEVEQDIFLQSQFTRYDKRRWSWNWLELSAQSVEDKQEARGGYPTVLMMAALRNVSSVKPFVYRRMSRTTYRWVSTGGSQSTWLP